MMRRRFTPLAILLFIGACSLSDSTAPARATGTANRAISGDDEHDGRVIPGSIGKAGSASANGQDQRLACNVPAQLSGSAIVGPSGGELDIGPHRLIIPPGALTRDTLISGTVPQGASIEIHLEPHGLRFNKPAGLILDVSSCGKVPDIIYIDEQGTISQRIRAVFSTWWHTIAAPIDHFSIYALDV